MSPPELKQASKRTEENLLVITLCSQGWTLESHLPISWSLTLKPVVYEHMDHGMFQHISSECCCELGYPRVYLSSRTPVVSQGRASAPPPPPGEALDSFSPSEWQSSLGQEKTLGCSQPRVPVSTAAALAPMGIGWLYFILDSLGKHVFPPDSRVSASEPQPQAM